MESNRGKTEIIIRCMLLVYLAMMVKLIIFKYPMPLIQLMNWRPEIVSLKLETANFVPLDTIKMYIQYHHKLNSVENLVGNLVAFIPLGLLLPLSFGRAKRFFVMLFLSLVIICCVETTQLVTGLGEFDVDDIILNMVGAMAGYILWRKYVYAKYLKAAVPVKNEK